LVVLEEFLEKVREKFQQNPMIYVLILLLGVIVIFLLAARRKRSVPKTKPTRIIEKHFYGSPPGESGSPKPKASSSSDTAKAPVTTGASSGSSNGTSTKGGD